MKNTLLTLSVIVTAGLVACDGPVEPTEAPESTISFADGVTFAGGPPAGGSRADAALANGQTHSSPRPDESGDETEGVVGGAVEGSSEDPAIGSSEDEQEAEAEATEPTVEEPAAVAPAPKYTGSPATLWGGQSTGTLPKFGVNCRLATDEVLESPTNGLIDDTLLLTTHDANTATVDILVQDASGEVLNVNVDINRALTGRSFRYALGTANTADAIDIPVMDGTLCFQNKALPGQDVLAEFSFILNDGGTYRSVAGIAVVPGSAIGSLNGLSIDAEDAMEIDLR
jgi:hypothetical protein